MNNPKYLPNFIRHCMTIGEIPTSYKVSLTYEEQLMWFCKFLEDQVIPVVNNNSEVVKELQTYIENYFENLDVQEEINNKLDEMAEDGTLEEIITEYINLKSVLAFNTKAEMKSATNLVNGSFTKTYGTTSYNDGYGEFYKIRTLLNTDVIDDDNIVALTNYPTLIAEKMPNANINNINNEINNLKKLVNKKYIFIGDSYNTTDTPQGGVPIVPWSTPLVAYLNLTSSDYYNSGVSGAGWVNGTTFLQQLQTLANSMTQDIKNSITDIIVLGGINDAIDTDIYTAISTFSNYVKTNFPNALITIGMISWAKGETNRKNLRTKMQIYNNMSEKSNIRVIENAFTWFHNYLHYQPDGHPNDAGSRTIAYFLANFLKGGENSVKWYNEGVIASSGNELGIQDGIEIGTMKEMFNGDMASLRLYFNNSITMNKSNFNLGGTKFKIGEIAPQTIYIPANSPATVLGNVPCWLYHNNNFVNTPVRLVLEGISLYGIFEEAINGTVSSELIHLGNPETFVIPAEYC